MATVKINNKNYTVPQLGFGHMQTIESEGISVLDTIRKRQAFSMVTALIIICTGLPVEDANKLAEQHILGGGDLSALLSAFTKAVDDSAFFKKLLEDGEEEESTNRIAKAKK